LITLELAGSISMEGGIVISRRLVRKDLLTVGFIALALALLLTAVLQGDITKAAGEPIVAPYDSSGLVWGDALQNTLVLFNTGNTRGVSSGPTTPATFTTTDTYTITRSSWGRGSPWSRMLLLIWWGLMAGSV
jgi:hypothetical protein